MVFDHDFLGALSKSRVIAKEQLRVESEGAAWSDEYKAQMQADMDALAKR